MELKQKAKKLLKIISISSASTGAVIQILKILSIAVPSFAPVILFGVCIVSMAIFFALPKTLHEKIELIFDSKTTQQELKTIKEKIEEELKKDGTVYNQPIHITLPK
jgi:hypothetical protein